MLNSILASLAKLLLPHFLPAAEAWLAQEVEKLNAFAGVVPQQPPTPPAEPAPTVVG